MGERKSLLLVSVASVASVVRALSVVLDVSVSALVLV